MFKFVMTLLIASYTIFFIHLFRLAILVLKIACLSKLEQVSQSRRVTWALLFVGWADAIHSGLLFGLEWAPRYWGPFDLWLPWLDIGLLVAKVVLAVVCLRMMGKCSAFVIVAAGLLLDVMASLTQLWYGMSAGDDPKMSLLTTGIVLFGLIRVLREERIQTIAYLGDMPLWLQVVALPKVEVKPSGELK